MKSPLRFSNLAVSDGSATGVLGLQTIWRRKWSIIGLSLAVMLLTVLVERTSPPIYRAYSTLLIEPQTLSTEKTTSLDDTGNQFLQTQLELLKSRNLAERVVRELGLTSHPELDLRQRPEPRIEFEDLLDTFDSRESLPGTMPTDSVTLPPEPKEAAILASAVKSLMAHTSISPINKSQQVRIEVEMTDALMAALAAHALANAYIESQMKESPVLTGHETANARIVGRVSVPDKPVNAIRVQIVALSGLLAVIAGAGLTLTLDRLNNKFKSSDDIENKLKLPVLAKVPLLRSEPRDEIVRLFNSSRHMAFCESIRSIRTAIILSGLDRSHKVLVITSSAPGEGKSSIAANLAFALGRMEKVLLIDANLQRPSIAENFGQPVDSPGLTNWLAGTARAEECIHRVDGIEVIAAGTASSSSLALLSSERFTESVDYLGHQYDRIVIDSPPTRSLSDALVLATVADAVIYVIKFGTTAVPVAQKAISKLLLNQAPVIGIVLNQVDVKKGKKYGNWHDRSA